MPTYVALTTVAKAADAARLARRLVVERAAACVNVLPGARSFYMWKGKRCEDGEFLLVIKTTRAALPRLKRLLREHHPYEVHELVAWPIREGSAPYLRWVEEACRPLRKTKRKR